jgi:pilus assembly protein CpaB
VVDENLRVLGMDLNANPNSSQPAIARTATLEVTAQDAVKLALASQAGTLSLALRRIGSDQTEAIRPMLVKDLGSFDVAGAPAAHKAAQGESTLRRRPRAASPGGTITVVEGAASANVAVPSEHILGAL